MFVQDEARRLLTAASRSDCVDDLLRPDNMLGYFYGFTALAFAINQFAGFGEYSDDL